MKKKNNTWIKILIVVVVLELLIGGGIFAYKKLHKETKKNDIKNDKIVQQLYKKIAYEDIDTMDILSNEAMLYYGYHNIEEKQSINCDVVEIEGNIEGYSCNKIADFIPKDAMEKKVKDIYGPTVTVSMIDFQADLEHYAFYDKQAEGFVIYDSEKELTTSPTNLKLKEAEKKDNQLILTTEVLDGIYGTVIETYKYIFEKNDDNYYLVGKEKISN